MVAQLWGMWDSGEGDACPGEVVLDCLMPTGVLIPLRAHGDAPLEEIKESLWQESQKYPLYSLLMGKDKYNFQCVNYMAEKEELLDETKRICDVKPFHYLLKVVEKKGDKTEKILNTKISNLIGKSLQEFDAIKIGEVPEFRGRMKQMCKSIGRERDSELWLQRALHIYPPDLTNEQALLPHHLENLPDRNFRIAVRLDSTGVTYTVRVPIEAFPDELVNTILFKKSNKTGCEVEDKDNFFLRISGRDEYLLGKHPLSQFKYLRKMVSKNETPQLVLVTKEVLMKDEPPILPPPRRNGLGGSHASLLPALPTLSRKKSGYITWDLSDRYSVTIHGVTNVDYEDYAKLCMRVGIYHGDEIMCAPLNTKPVYVTDRCATWDETLMFDIQLADIPRMARLCCLLYYAYDKRVNKKGGTVGRKVKEGRQEVVTLSWLNFTLFDYKDMLRTGHRTVYMWPIRDDSLLSEELLNPIGTVECNPSGMEATCLTLTFNDYNLGGHIFFPSFDKVLEVAAKTLDCSSPDSQNLPAVHNEDPVSLLQRLDSVTFDETKVTKTHLESLRVMIDRDPLTVLHEQEKEMIWLLKHECRRHFPRSLPKLLRCMNWNHHVSVAVMQALLQVWEPLPPTQALELLDYHFADREVRKFAVQCLQHLTDSDLCQYLLQLVQVLKYESYLECDLVAFLLRRALENQRIGHYFFWLLRSEMHVPSLSVRFGVILEAYCRGNIKHMKMLCKQAEALQRLKTLSILMKDDKYKDIGKKAIKDKARAELAHTLQLPAFSTSLSDLTATLNPSYLLLEPKINECKFMDSKMRPLWLVWKNQDPLGSDIYIMYKNGDDLRQDMLTLQILGIMDNMWQEEGLDLRLNAYQCLPTGCNEGLIEIVLNSDTIANIQKKYSSVKLNSAFNKESLYKHLKQANPDDGDLHRAMEEFLLSCAGYCVATYVLGIGDRHSDNILLKTNGQLFHIDFGHILGHFKTKMGVRRERVPFVLTPDFIYVIRGGPADSEIMYRKFKKCCEDAYLILHRKSSFLITLFMMMMNTGIPEVSSVRDVEFLRETLKPDYCEDDALRHFREKYNDALKNSTSAQINFMIHNFAKDNT